MGTLVGMDVVELRQVGRTVGTVPILSGIDLAVRAGERLGVAGPNGAGKTTLLGVISTLTAPTHGGGHVLGAALGTDAVTAVRPRIGWSGHEPALYDELTLAENLRHVARLIGRDPGDADEVLDLVGLGAAGNRRAEACSNGMRRRADLARLLLTGPVLVLLDEAHAGLDAAASVIIDELGRRAVAKQGAVVMVSHDPTLLEERVDRLVQIHDGRLVG